MRVPGPAKSRGSRRRFLSTALMGTAGLTAAFRASGIPSVFAAPTPAVSELDEATIMSLQQAVKSGHFSACALTQHYLDRIEAIDKQGPVLKSVIEVNPDALAMAESLDKERASKGALGPLHGIPVLVKDNISTGDRMLTSAGSLALAQWVAPQDAFVVKKLRDAGAVILGKTNLSEWANIRSSHSTSGWSARGGLTKNPYALDRNPSGSSSGSAAAVAANLCVAAVGTETDGSIVSPGSSNGIVGIKPTLGLLSRSGIVPIAHSQDTPGPMARTVADAAALLTVMAGFDPEDSATESIRGKEAIDYTRFLDPNGLKGARLGVIRKYFGFNDAVDALMNDLLGEMTRAGATVVDSEMATFGKFDDSELEVLLYELKADLNQFLGKTGPKSPVHSLADVIKFNEEHRRQEMPYFGQDLFVKAEAKGPLTEKAYLDALAQNRRMTRDEGVDAMMDKLHLDALVAPTAGPAWLTDLANGDHAAGGSSNTAAVAGYPDITVPAGFVFGLPVGISFFGKAFSEPALIKIAYAFEQLTKTRKPPQFLPATKMPV